MLHASQLGGLNEVGLILSFLLATFFCTIAFFWNYKNDINFAKLKITKSKFNLAYKYRQFPLLNAPASILNGITLALPVFFLARDYPEAILGYYALMTRVMMSPLSLISSSVSLVHLRVIADMVQRSLPVFGYMAKLTCFLLFFAGIPGVVFFIAGPDIFALIFGEKWRLAGEFISIMIPGMVIKFVVSTLSPVFSSTGNSHIAAGWRLLGFLVTISIFINYSGKLTIFQLLHVIVVSDIVLYSLYYLLVCYALKRPKNLI